MMLGFPRLGFTPIARSEDLREALRPIGEPLQYIKDAALENVNRRLPSGAQMTNDDLNAMMLDALPVGRAATAATASAKGLFTLGRRLFGPTALRNPAVVKAVASRRVAREPIIKAVGKLREFRKSSLLHGAARAAKERTLARAVGAAKEDAEAFAKSSPMQEWLAARPAARKASRTAASFANYKATDVPPGAAKAWFGAAADVPRSLWSWARTSKSFIPRTARALARFYTWPGRAAVRPIINSTIKPGVVRDVWSGVVGTGLSPALWKLGLGAAMGAWNAFDSHKKTAETGENTKKYNEARAAAADDYNNAMTNAMKRALSDGRGLAMYVDNGLRRTAERIRQGYGTDRDVWDAFVQNVTSSPAAVQLYEDNFNAWSKKMRSMGEPEDLITREAFNEQFPSAEARLIQARRYTEQ